MLANYILKMKHNLRSIFLRKEGATAKNRILDFLAISDVFYFSLRQISNRSGVKYSKAKKVHKELLANNWLATKKHGKVNAYKLNYKNIKVRDFVKRFESIIDAYYAEQEPRAIYTQSGAAAAQMSAKTV